MTVEEEGGKLRKPSADVSVRAEKDLASDWVADLPHFAAAREGITPQVKSPKRRLLRWFFMAAILAALSSWSFMAFSGKGVALPKWAIDRLEQRLNQTIAGSHLPKDTLLSLSGLEFAFDKDFAPRFILRDLQLEQKGQNALIALPQTQVTLSASALLRGELRPKSLVLLGAQVAVTRDQQGRLGFDIGGLSGQEAPETLGQFFESLDRMFASNIFEDLTKIEGQALGVNLKDLRAEREWSFGDGRLVLENHEDRLAIELGMTLLNGAQPAQASLGAVTSKKDHSARLWANVDQIDAADLAVQAAPFAVLAMIDAPISGKVSANLDEKGLLGEFEGHLTLSEGKVEAVGGGRPIDFENATVSLRYDMADQRVMLDQLSVQSPSLKLQAQGWGDLLTNDGFASPSGDMPQVVVSQLNFSEVMVDPEGLFVEPVRFSSGSADFRITLAPFKIEIGQLRLNDGQDHLQLSGHMGQALPAGWQGAIDVSVNRMDSNRLLKVWPLIAVPKTRNWLNENVGQAVLKGVNAAIRFYPDREPRFALDYDFEEAEVRFLRTLPPITRGRGHASILGNVYTMVIDEGHVSAPQGGDINVDGSMFQVLDIMQKPAQAEVTLLTSSTLEAALSLLDQEPFNFLSKANLTPDLAQGRAELTTILRFPLVAKMQMNQISYSVRGTLHELISEKLVKGRKLSADIMQISATPRQLSVSGAAALDGALFNGTFEQSLVKGEKGKATVKGVTEVTAEGLRRLGVDLPEGWLNGRSTADFTLNLEGGTIPKLSVKSNLQGLSLSVLGWTKPAQLMGELAADVLLGPEPTIQKLSLKAADLSLVGQVKTKAGQGLDRFDIDQLKIGNWLDIRLELRGHGKGNAPTVKILGGNLALSGLPKQQRNSGASSSRPTQIEVNLDRVEISKTLVLTGFSGAITPQSSGVSGQFIASLNGKGRLNGAMKPRNGGTAVQVWSSDAGTIMAAAGVFKQGRGGTLNLTVQPEKNGDFLGNASFTGLSIQNAPILAAMLSSASVIGLVDQLQGQGIYFSEGDLAFRVSPQGIEILQGSAFGASMGISFSGLYRHRDNQIDVQGTISPIYLLNGLGQIFASKGEGLFGFNYRLSGPAGNPSVMVNPLSILTPGRFREIFRRPTPVFERAR